MRQKPPTMTVIDEDFNASRIISPTVYPLSVHFLAELKGFDNPLPEECEAAADALNALDRDGVAWGPGRPMEELPGDPAGTRSVLVLYRGVETPEVRPARLIHLDRSNPERLCWWPLPGEATT